jgi:DNA-binding CsgD family transcriptional regulator
VDHHLRSVYRKFGITSRAELVRLAGQLDASDSQPREGG